MNISYSYRAGVVAVAILGGALMTGCEKKAAATAPPQQQAVEVGVVTVQPQRVSLTTELPGRTSAFLVAEVRPQVGGIVQKRAFTEGSDVKAGELLYQIDPSVYQAAYASAKAALARAEANVVPIRLRSQRYNELVAINAVSKQECDDTNAQLKQAEAEIEGAKAALERARIDLAYTKVTAPISGRIGKSSVTTGALVTANQAAPLATIQQLGQVYVDVTQTSADLLRLKGNLAAGKMKKNGAQAKVKLVLENGQPYPQEGTLKFSDVTVDQSTGSVTVRTLFPNPNEVLLPGMYVRALLEEGVTDNAILVPQRGVTRDPSGNPLVMVVGAEEKVEPRIIKADRTVGDSWLVTDGLKAGDRVILEGIMKARPGTPVKAVPFGAKPEGAPTGPGAGQQAASAAKKQ